MAAVRILIEAKVTCSEEKKENLIVIDQGA